MILTTAYICRLRSRIILQYIIYKEFIQADKYTSNGVIFDYEWHICAIAIGELCHYIYLKNSRFVQ